MKVRLHYHQAPGDTLTSTAAVASLQRQYPGKFLLEATGTAAAAIFENNPHVEGFDGKPDITVRMENPLINESHLPWHFMHSYVKTLKNALNVDLELSVNRPELYVSEKEKGWVPRIKEILGRRLPYWLIQQPGAKSDYTVKYWPREYLQEVVDKLRGKILFVQVGSEEHNHKPLKGVIDEIGNTDTRQLIRLAYHADGALSGESFLHHMMAAFAKPCVTIASGWLAKQWVSYPTCTMLSRHGCLSCCKDKACGKTRVVDLEDGDSKSRNLCELPVLSFEQPAAYCMADIKPDEVVRACETILNGFRVPKIGSK